MKLSAVAWIAFLVTEGILGAQTRVDLRTQAKSVDFSSAESTKPFQTGTALPAGCAVGQTYFKTDAPAGANLYACTSTDTWTAVGAKEPAAGDVSGPMSNLSVKRLQGRAVTSAEPVNGNVLKWNSGTSQWEPGNAVSSGTALPAVCTVGQTYFKTDAPAGANLYACTSANTWTAVGANELPAFSSFPGRVLSNDGTVSKWIDPAGDVTGSLSSLTVTKLQGKPVANAAPAGGSVLKWNSTTEQWEPASAVPSGATLPSVCVVGQTYFKTDAPAGANLHVCTSANTWMAVGVKELPVVAGNQGKILTNDGTTAQWSAPGGDVTGQMANLTVGKLQGKSVAAGNPTEGSVLKWNEAAGQWEPATPFPSGTTLPATCARGQSYIKTDATAGENLYLCTDQDVWTAMGVKELPAPAGNAGKALTTDGESAAWIAPGGDVSGTLNNLTVARLQGRAVSNASPAEGSVLRWNGANNEWEMGAAGTANYSSSFSGATAVTIPGSEHGMTSVNLVVTCYDDGSPARTVEPDTVGIDLETLDIQIAFATPQSGRCVVNGSGGASSSGTGGGGSIGNLEVGAGMMMLQTADITTLSIDSTVVPTFLTNSAILSIPAIAAGRCTTTTLTLPGAAVGDPVAPGWPASLGSDIVGTMWVQAAGTVSIRACNMGAAASSPITDFFRAAILRSF